MDRTSWLQLSDVQLPVLLDEEQELLRERGVGLYDGDERTNFDKGDLTLTTHRLLWVEQGSQRRALYLPLQSVSHVEAKAGFLMSSPKVLAFLYPAVPNAPAGPVLSSRHHQVRFSFRKSEAASVSQFAQRITKAIAAKGWVPKPKSPDSAALKHSAGTSLGAGITGIKRVEKKKIHEADESIKAAFNGDLEDLMERAKDMVKLLATYSHKLAAGDATAEDSASFDSYLTNLGISNPVTKESHGAGKTYQRQLARELAGFLKEPLAAANGTLALADVYCLYNRARGSELLSPDDLVLACRQFEPLKLPVSLRTFPSGVLVVQSRQEDDAALLDKIRGLLGEHKSLTAATLAGLTRVSAVLAAEQLLTAERAGQVCRDENIEGLRFYPNLFLDGE